MNKFANYGIKFAFYDIMYTVSHEEARVSIASNYYAYNVKILPYATLTLTDRSVDVDFIHRTVQCIIF